MNEYLKCKKCGGDCKKQLENRITGEITKFDICYDCYIGSFKFKPITEQIVLEKEIDDERRV